MVYVPVRHKNYCYSDLSVSSLKVFKIVQWFSLLIRRGYQSILEDYASHVFLRYVSLFGRVGTACLEHCIHGIACRGPRGNRVALRCSA